MIESCFGSGRTFKDRLVQRPCHGLGHLSLDEVAQSPIQPDLLPHWPRSMTRDVEPSLQCSVESKFMILFGPLLQEGVKPDSRWVFKVRYQLAPGSWNSTYLAARHLFCPVFLAQFVSDVFFWSHPVATCVMAQDSTATTCWCS